MKTGLTVLLLWLGFFAVGQAAENKAHGKFLGAMETHYPDWFKTSFLDINEDVAEAAADGRRVMMIFHQDNCPYCNVLVERNLAQKDIEQMMKERFDVIAINMWGDRDVATVDGKALTEKSLARALKVQFTPTLLVLNEKGGLALRLNGYIPPAEFKQALTYASTHDAPDGYRAFLEKQGVGGASGEWVTSDLFTGQKAEVPAVDQQPVALVFEQRDCPACQQMHDTVLKDSETREWLKPYRSYQLDMWSDQQQVRYEGETLSARELANRLQVKYAPTMVLFDPEGKEVIRAEAMFKSFHTQSMLDYVANGDWKTEPDFQRYLSNRAERIRETGRDVDIWK